MKVISSINILNKWVHGKQIGFVPTMGNLHEGHLALVRAARKRNKFVVVSIFINPKQFGPNEDFNTYPRTLVQDKALLLKEKVNVLFCPKATDIYGYDQNQFQTYIGNKFLENLYCGKYRPGFFNGVLLVVLKLFNLIKPVDAYFGKKDYQQYILIKRMVSDLNLAINIHGITTKRTAGGLALSSRNRYLNDKEQKSAEHIHQCLKLGRNEVREGRVASPKMLEKYIRIKLKKNTSLKTQYLEVVDKFSLQRAEKVQNAIILYAGFYGAVRLIDNIET